MEKNEVDLTKEIDIIMLHIYEIGASHGLSLEEFKVNVVDVETVRRSAALISATKTKRH